MCGHIFSVPLSKYQEPLSCIVCKNLLNFVGNLQTVPDGHTICIFNSLECESSYWSTFSPILFIVSVLDSSLSNCYAVVFYCYFNVHFPNYIWCQACYHILIAICLSSLVSCLLNSDSLESYAFILLNFRSSVLYFG